MVWIRIQAGQEHIQQVPSLHVVDSHNVCIRLTLISVLTLHFQMWTLYTAPTIACLWCAKTKKVYCWFLSWCLLLLSHFIFLFSVFTSACGILLRSYGISLWLYLRKILLTHLLLVLNHRPCTFLFLSRRLIFSSHL